MVFMPDGIATCAPGATSTPSTPMNTKSWLSGFLEYVLIMDLYSSVHAFLSGTKKSMPASVGCAFVGVLTSLILVNSNFPSNCLLWSRSSSSVSSCETLWLLSSTSFFSSDAMSESGNSTFGLGGGFAALSISAFMFSWVFWRIPAIILSMASLVVDSSSATTDKLFMRSTIVFSRSFNSPSMMSTFSFPSQCLLKSLAPQCRGAEPTNEVHLHHLGVRNQIDFVLQFTHEHACSDHIAGVHQHCPGLVYLPTSFHSGIDILEILHFNHITFNYTTK